MHAQSVADTGAGALTSKSTDDVAGLFAACKSGNLKEAEFYMKKFTPQQITALLDNDGWGPFHFIAMKGHLPLAELFVGYGVPVDIRDKFGSTPLYRAVGFGQNHMVYYLVDKGANPLHINDAGDDMVHNSAWAGNAELTRFFLEKGVSPIRKNKSNHISLMDMVKMIPDVADEWLSTRTRIVNKYLLRVQTEYDFDGIDDMDLDVDEMTPLELIVKKRNHDLVGNRVIRKLLAWKWDVFAKKTFATEVFFYMGAVSFLTYICISLIAYPNTVIFVYDSAPDYVRGGLEIAFAFYSVFAFFVEMRKFFNGGRDIIQIKPGFGGILLRIFFPSAKDPALIKARCVAVPRYIRNIQNIFELSTCIMVIIDAAIRIANIVKYKKDGTSIVSVQIEFNLLAIVCVLFWFKSLRFASLITFTGPLIETIKRMMWDVILFLFIYSVFLMGFALAFYLLLAPENSVALQLAGDKSFDGFPYTLLTTFLGLVGLWSYDPFRTANKSVAYIGFVMYIIIANIMLLNLLIAMLSNTYGKVIYVAEKEFLLLRAQYILDVQKQLGKKVVAFVLQNDIKNRKMEGVVAENNTPDIELTKTEKYSEWEKEKEYQVSREINLQLLRDDLTKLFQAQSAETAKLVEGVSRSLAEMQAKVDALKR